MLVIILLVYIASCKCNWYSGWKHMSTMQKEGTVACPWQQSLCERARILRCTCLVYLCSTDLKCANPPSTHRSYFQNQFRIRM